MVAGRGVTEVELAPTERCERGFLLPPRRKEPLAKASEDGNVHLDHTSL
jgi:hypothetical protein